MSREVRRRFTGSGHLKLQRRSLNGCDPKSVTVGRYTDLVPQQEKPRRGQPVSKLWTKQASGIDPPDFFISGVAVGGRHSQTTAVCLAVSAHPAPPENARVFTQTATVQAAFGPAGTGTRTVKQGHGRFPPFQKPSSAGTAQLLSKATSATASATSARAIAHGPESVNQRVRGSNPGDCLGRRCPRCDSCSYQEATGIMATQDTANVIAKRALGLSWSDFAGHM